MPNNFLNADISFPTFTADQTDGEKMDVVTNYLYMLLEQLRYTLGNLGAGNFNDAELEDIGKHIREPVYIELESISGDITKLEVTTSGLTSTVQSQGGDISTLKQTANALSSTVQSQGGSISKLEQTASGLSVTVYGNPEDPEDTGLNGKVINLSFTLDGLTVTDTEGTTLINGSSVYTDNLYVKAANITGTLTAQALQGQKVNLINSDDEVSGYIRIAKASSADEAVRIYSYGAMAFLNREGNIYFEADDVLQLTATAEVQVDATSLLPSQNGAIDLGSSIRKWNDIYAINGTINTSDRQEKTDISYGLEEYDSLFDKLRPCSFRFLGRNRLHTGLISQDVQEAMEEEGVSDMDFAAFIKSTSSDGDHYGLRYTEFIALLIDQVQKLKSRVINLEGKVFL